MAKYLLDSCCCGCRSLRTGTLISGVLAIEERPNLIVPWLVVGSIRCMIVNLITLLTGSCVCLIQKGQHPICLDFVISQVIEHGPAVYAWLTILSYYKDLKFFCKEEKERNTLERELVIRRRKARRMDSSHLEEKVNDGRNLISESILGSLMHSLQSESTPSCSRSLDSLLRIKSTKEAKEELMYSDSVSEEEQSSSILDRAMRILNVENDDILKAKSDKEQQALKGEICKLRYNISHECISANGEEDSQSKSIDEHPTDEEEDKCKCKTQTSVEHEVELGSISLEVPISKIAQLTNLNVTKTVEEHQLTVKPDFLEKIVKIKETERVNEVHGDIQRRSNFGCQVSTISKSLLSQPPEEVTKKFRFSRQIIFHEIM